MKDFTIIVAYDGSAHADDAVALASLLAKSSDSRLLLAHVYRAGPAGAAGGANSARERERFLTRSGEELLAHGTRLVDPNVDVEQRVVGSTTTATGIRTLAEREGPGLVVFGSASGTLPGRVHPGSAARRLLQVMAKPLAVAPAGFSESRPEGIATVAVAADDNLDSARRSAEAVASTLGARIAAEPTEPGSLLLVGSGEDTESGRLRLTSRGDRLIRAATVPVVAVPYGEPLHFPARRGAPAAA